MNREEYIKYRTEKSPIPMYEFYKENFNEEKHKRFLGIEEFFKAMNVWEGAMEAFSNVMAFYDAKFIIMKVTNLKTGALIKYL